MNERYKEIIEKVYAERIRQGTERNIETLASRAEEASDSDMAKLLTGVDAFVEDWESGKIIAGYENMRNRGNVVKAYDVEAKQEYETFDEAIKDFRK